jgi:hypothetical protein
MTDKVQKIREEVEKLHGNPYYMMAVKDVLEILDMQEEPVSKELKVELEKYIKDHFTIDTEQLNRFGIEEKDYMYSMDKSDMLALVEHFINWHKTKEEPVTEDLEKAAEDYGVRQGLELKPFAIKYFKDGAKWQEAKDQSTIELAEDHAMLAGMEKLKEQIMANTADAMIGLPYENKDGGYTHLIDVSRPLPVGNNKIAIIFKEG